jgi:hypothetical protein
MNTDIRNYLVTIFGALALLIGIPVGIFGRQLGATITSTGLAEAPGDWPRRHL